MEAFNKIPFYNSIQIFDSYAHGHSIFIISFSLLSILYIFWFYAFSPRSLPLFLIKSKRRLHYFTHPTDLLSLGIYFFTRKLPIPPNIDDNWNWCYEKLKATSRSFYTVILELNAELREPVCLFYLILRALDTIEDDMEPDVKTKKKELISFHTHLEQSNWNLKGFGKNPHEIDLVKNFDRLIECFKQLKPKYRTVICNICERMGKGMADFLETKIESIDNWDLYCHYVAGLVGCGLSSLFSSSELEKCFDGKEIETLSNSMGLFLQKTNIIRDYLEDISEVPPRMFWPREIWGKYVKNLRDFTEYKYRLHALSCLNELVGEALKHSLECLAYIKCLKEPSIFKFCAIPQVMAISTLSYCYNNYDVFLYEVKIPKGEAVSLILKSNCYSSVVKSFLYYAKKILYKIPNDVNSKITKIRVLELIDFCNEELKK